MNESYTEKAQPIRAAINARPLTDFYQLQKSKGKLFCCPLCGSGTGPNHTGALSIKDMGEKFLVKCFACDGFGKGTDTLGALRKLYEGKTEKEVFEICGYRLDQDPQPAPKKPEKKKPAEKPAEKPAVSFAAKIAQWAAALPGSEGERYLLNRGITAESMDRFKLGFEVNRHGGYITIPYNQEGTYYIQRVVYGNGYKHVKPKDEDGTLPEPVFHPDALYRSDICFVVESPLCAISIEQCGYPAVALGGTGGDKLVKLLDDKPAKATLIICLDNEFESKKGRDKAKELGEKLEKIGISAVNGIDMVLGENEPGIPGSWKDPNDELQADPEELRKRLQYATEETRYKMELQRNAEAEERAKRTGPGMITEFLKIIQSEKYKPVPTGIRDIDEAIGGGFIRQQLVLLGAAPGAGKTALTQWIFEGIAEKGTADCLYLNLEMSRDQLLARAMSRFAKRDGNRIRTLDVLQGYKWTDLQMATVLVAAEEYEKGPAQHMVYNPDGLTNDLDCILDYMEKEAARLKAEGRRAPFCVIDYLQMIRGGPKEDAAETIKRAVYAFKKYAIENDTIVFVIIAHNRESNRSGDATMESGRDTSALEYSADLQMALTLTKCLRRPGQDPKRPDDLTREEKALKTLKITKGRFGGEETEVDLYFDGETMTFTQIQAGLQRGA